MMAAIEELAQSIPVSQACAVFDFPRSSLYRRRQRSAELTSKPKAIDAQVSHATLTRALSGDERARVRDLLGPKGLPERFVDRSPYEVYATLLDEGVYHCSISTM